MKIFCIIFVFSFFVADSFAIFWKKCPNGNPPTDIVSSQCDDESCSVKKGEIFRGDVTFSVTENHVNANVKFYAVLLGLEIDITSLGTDVTNICQNLANGMTCPLIAGVEYVWNMNFLVPLKIPIISKGLTRGKFRLQHNIGQTFIDCFNWHFSSIC